MIYFRIDRVGAAVALVGVFATYCWAQETVVPVTNAGFHQFTFQDENMSLENVTLPAGYSTGYHSHEQDLVFVITGGAKIKNQVLGKDPVELEFKQCSLHRASQASRRVGPGISSPTTASPTGYGPCRLSISGKLVGLGTSSQVSC